MSGGCSVPAISSLLFIRAGRLGMLSFRRWSRAAGGRTRATRAWGDRLVLGVCQHEGHSSCWCHVAWQV